MTAAATVFICLLALDFVWAKYTYAMTQKRPVLAGGYAAVLIVLSGSAAIGYVNDPWMLLPAAGGAFSGTALAVILESRK